MGAGRASSADAAQARGGASDAEAAERLLLRLTEAPDALLRESPEIAAAARTAAEGLYAELAAHQASGAVACPELYTAGFDAEQIWYQLDLQLIESLKRVKKTLKSIEKSGHDVQLLPDGLVDEGSDGAHLTLSSPPRCPPTEPSLRPSPFLNLPSPLLPAVFSGGSDDDGEGPSDEGDELDGEDGSEDDGDDDDGLDDDDEGIEDEEEGEGDEDERPARRRGRLPTEDAFFSLDDMERFVGDAEALEARGDGEEEEEEDRQGNSGGKGSDDDEEDEDEGIDFFSADAGAAGGGGGIDAAIALSRSLVAGGGAAGKKGREGAAAAAAASSTDGAEGGDIFYEEFFGPKRGGGRRGEYEDGDDDAAGADGGDDDWDMAGADGDGDDAADDDDDEDEGGDTRRQRGGGAGTSGRKARLLGGDDDGDDDDGGVEGGEGRRLSSYQKRQAKIQAQIEDLEQQNMGAKDWFMRGEARAGDRPVNSALEVAMDFEHAQMPAPVITEDVTKSLEEIIRLRVAEQRWDDPQRKVAPAAPRGRKLLELSDEKSKKGLGELYEEDFLKQQKEARRAAAGAAGEAAAAIAGIGGAAGTEAEEPEETDLQRDVKALWKALGGKLDSLSHFVYAPKPVLEEMAVRGDAPAITMEEVAPGTASAASLRAPEEVFKGGAGAVVAGGVRGSAAGQVRGKDELSKEERKAARAKKKRKGRAARAEAEGDRAKRRKVADAANAVAEAAGFKAKKELGSATTIGKKGDRSDFAKSAKVFAKLQDAKEAGVAAAAAGGKKGAQQEKKQPLAGGGSARLKL